MESMVLLPAHRAQMRRRRRQLLQAILRALARPLVLVRRARRQAKNFPGVENIRRSFECLRQELSLAAQAVRRRLNAGGGRDSRPLASKKMAGRWRQGWGNATGWSRLVMAACQGCATRLCRLLRAAEALADRTTTRLAYGLLRTLEKELWLLHPHPTRDARLAVG